MRYSGIVVLASVTLILGGCADQPLGPGPQVNSHQPGATVAGDVATTFQGAIGPGSSYEIQVPPSWNGDLVLYAHGYVDPQGQEPLTAFEQSMLQQLPTLGYAVAYSSFSKNGLAVKDAIQRTKQLRGIFVSKVREPTRTYVTGGSMGGLVALALAERFPGQYDGALALCGMVGGSQAQIDYVSNVRVLFDAFYPGALPGSLFDNQPLIPTQVAAAVATAVQANPGGLAALNSVMATTFGTPLPGATPADVVTSLVSALTFDVRGFSDVLDATHGHSPFDNTAVHYAGSPDDAALNLAVARYTATPDALAYLAHYYTPSGALTIPTVTLHNALDPVVPAFHESLLAEAVDNAGDAGSLVQLTSSTFGHCDFSTPEVMGAFSTLAGWVESGVRPGS
ncbi:MAG: tannase/feruloyl esterase family alpha/beta hydrolase [Gemmatimonadetes bacterium]|nr:tannase/feruloyl esterase family alpha/beta hydrolase [Gemmatimonadota bacterium]